MKKAGSKYGAVRHGRYASKREADTASKLWALEHAGLIHDLREQVRFTLVPGRNGIRPVVYVADFTYIENDLPVVADAKGFRTPVYKLKKRMMALLLGIEVLEL